VPDEDAQLRARITSLSDPELARMLTLEAENYRDEALAIGKEEALRRNLDFAVAGSMSEWGSHPAATNRQAPSLTFVNPLPVEELARFRIAFVLTALSIAIEIATQPLAEPHSYLGFYSIVGILVLCKFEYLRIVYRLHRALQIATGGRYPHTAPFSVVGHFVPIYSFYWLVEWPGRVARCAEVNGRSRPLDCWLPGLALILGIWGVGSLSGHNAMFFGAAWYTQDRLVRGVAGWRSADGDPDPVVAK